MTMTIGPRIAAAVLACGLTVQVGAAASDGSQTHTAPSTPAGAQAVDDFLKHCQTYVALHKKIESGLPKLPQNATPEQIDQGQQALSKGIVTARANARLGDVFVPAAAGYLRETLVRVFSGRDGKQLRASILDENPIGAPVKINGPYPDAIPLSTMPPQILTALPKLPEELEYRFIGDRLILFDHHAHLIVDYVDRALPVV
jgi:hypothetical protein